MKQLVVALAGIGTALLIGCAQDAPPQRQLSFPANFEVVRYQGGTEAEPGFALVNAADLGVVTGADDGISFVELDQEVIADAIAAAPPNGLVHEGADRAVSDMIPLPAGTPDACDCPDQECVRDFIADNFGCNICVEFVCGDDPQMAGCNACP
ncbi:MAG TPA: hypothetical protein VL172_16715 [Kofleriaceae bacterium]|nr:hypothetical protein [Kofleriaceae bacterium]